MTTPVTKNVAIRVRDPGSPDPITGLVIQKDGAEVTSPVAINLNEEITLTAVLSPAGVTGTVIWTSNNAAVTVNPASGTMTAVKGVTGGGSAIITVSAANADTATAITKTVTVTVNEAGASNPVTGIDIQKDGTNVTGSVAINVNEEITMTAVMSPVGATGTVTWTSSNAAVTVNPSTGATTKVKGITGGGSATITASSINADTATAVTKTITVTVNEAGSSSPVTGIAIQKDGTNVTGSIAVDEDEETTLTTVLSPVGVTGTVTWTSSNAAVTVNPSTGATTKVKGITGGGSATITASATNADTQTPVTATITVTVNVPTNPNILFQWNAVDDPWASLSTGGANVRTYPAYPAIHIRAFGATIPAGTGGGIKLGGAGTSATGRLAIGQEAAVETAGSNTATTIAGDFDLSEKPVKVTVNYRDMVSYGDRYVFRVSVNNNTATAANSSLGTGCEIITYYGSSTFTNTKGEQLTETSGTIEAIIDPSSFQSNANKAALEHAFIAFHCQQANTAGQNNFITITGIKIEYSSTGSADIKVENPWTEPAFTGFPSAEFTLSKSGDGYSATRTITLTGYTQAAWYLDGESVENMALTYTVDATGLTKKNHYLTVTVTKNGNLYSRAITFMVIE
jgi:hypothetical protein